MNKTDQIWVIVANASEAKLFKYLGHISGVKPLKDWNNPAVRQASHNLVTDAQGKFNMGGNFEPHKSPQRIEMEHFARKLAEFLEKARIQNNFTKLILCSSPAFLGEITNLISAQVKERLKLVVNKDYTRLDHRDLTRHLNELMI
ncbi:MAG: host attachment protein [Proteobacteria bacterium]|nr:host attachment protein [Pseudomonadota bacterium]MDE3207759.1 host attachment protein [Pseudomonadota bacterium]